MADPTPAAFGAVLSLAGSFAVLLLAAKAHGRQVRLEREARGYDRVDFTADNPPWVEALWALDRRTYWGTAGLALVTLLAARFGPWGAPWPLPLGAPAESWVDGAVALLWAGVAAFTVAGLASLARLLRRLAGRVAADAPVAELEGPEVGRGPRWDDHAWRAAALRGSALWWGLSLGGTGVFWSLAAFAS